MLADQFLSMFLNIFLTVIQILLLDPVNLFCLAFLFLYTFGYVLILTAIARVSRKGCSQVLNEVPLTLGEAKPEIAQPPVISFIIPAHNEEEVIERKLKNTQSLNYPKDHLEVIVVDDGSTDNTLSILKEIKGSWFPELRIFSQSRQGKSAAENKGLRNSKGELIVTSDADVPLNSDALRFMIENFQDPKVGGVTCAVKAKESAVAFNIMLAPYVRRLETEVDSLFGMSGPFVSFRRSIIPKIDEGIFASDVDKGVIVRKKGYKVVYDPRIVSYVNQWVPSQPRSLIGVLKKAKHMFFGDIHIFLRHKDVVFRNRYGIYGWITAPRYILLNILAPILFMLLSVNSAIKLIESSLLIPFSLFITLFLIVTFLLKKVARNTTISKAFYFIFVYIIRLYALFFYFWLFLLKSGERRGTWR